MNVENAPGLSDVSSNRVVLIRVAASVNVENAPDLSDVARRAMTAAASDVNSNRAANESRSGYGDRVDRAGRGAARSEGDERRPFQPRGDDSRGSFRERGERREFKLRGDDSRGNFRERTDRRASKPPAPTAPEHASPAPQKAYAHRDGLVLVRLSKVMSELGLCSRREADEWIEKGWVLVDGEVVDTLGTRIDPTAISKSCPLLRPPSRNSSRSCCTSRSAMFPDRPKTATSQPSR